MSADEQLSRFIGAERWRFETYDNNLFGFSFSKILRYYRFLKVILARYEEVAAAFAENSKLVHDLPQKTGEPVTPEYAQLLDEGSRLSTRLHLEIESFYLFAKIFLDTVAHAIEFYFGPERSRPLDSHDDLTKNVERYAAGRGLTNLSADLLLLVRRLKEDISDLRDYWIAHEKSPRTMKGTKFFIQGPPNARMFAHRVSPTKSDSQVQTRNLNELVAHLDQYVELIIVWIEQNKDRTRLRLRASKARVGPD